MATSTEKILPAKFFTQSWAVTVPSYPGLKFYRATPNLFDQWLPIVMEPSNNELQDTASKVWDETAKTEWRARSQKRYETLNIEHNGLDMLVELDGELVGYGDIWKFGEAEASVGVVLNKAARGKGVGKVSIQVFTQLGFALGFEISTGTMKVNAPMRGIMKSLGIPEVEKVTELPGRGVVAEIDWKLKAKEWKSLPMDIEFGDPVA